MACSEYQSCVECTSEKSHCLWEIYAKKCFDWLRGHSPASSVSTASMCEHISAPILEPNAFGAAFEWLKMRLIKVMFTVCCALCIVGCFVVIVKVCMINRDSSRPHRRYPRPRQPIAVGVLANVEMQPTTIDLSEEPLLQPAV